MLFYMIIVLLSPFFTDEKKDFNRFQLNFIDHTEF